MRLASHLALALAILFAASGVARCDITYAIVNYSTDQLGYPIAGRITTDGSLGALTSRNILSWEVDLADVVLKSSAPGASVDCSNLIATSSQILLGAAAPGHPAYLVLATPPRREDSGFVNWNRDPGTAGLSVVGKEFVDQHALTLSGDEPWVIAQVTAAPEPSTLMTFGTAVALALCYGRVRRGRESAVGPRAIAHARRIDRLDSIT